MPPRSFLVEIIGTNTALIQSWHSSVSKACSTIGRYCQRLHRIHPIRTFVLKLKMISSLFDRRLHPQIDGRRIIVSTGLFLIRYRFYWKAIVIKLSRSCWWIILILFLRGAQVIESLMIIVMVGVVLVSLRNNIRINLIVNRSKSLILRILLRFHSLIIWSFILVCFNN